MYLKGKLKIGLTNPIAGGNETYEIRNYVNELNDDLSKSKDDLATIFYLKNDVEYKNYYEETFDNIVNSIIDDESTENKKETKIKITFRIDYYAKTNGTKTSVEDVKNKIESFLKNKKTKLTKKSNIIITKHITYVEKSIDAFDNLVYNKPSQLLKFYKGILNEQDISILTETYANCKVVKKEISKTKYNEDSLLKKFNYICKDDKISNEIHRIFSINDNKNIQGVNYLFKEDDYDIRQETYKALATTLYSKGRIDNPYYYVVNIDVNDKNSKSNIIYLKMRLKISRNDLYFFEFTDKGANNDNPFGTYANFNSEDTKFFNSLKESQFINIFGIYANDSAISSCCSFEPSYGLSIFG